MDSAFEGFALHHRWRDVGHRDAAAEVAFRDGSHELERPVRGPKAAPADFEGAKDTTRDSGMVR